MIRNHLLDPESSPNKQAGWVPPSYPIPSNINPNDDHDPWYSSSSNPSPTNANNIGSNNNNNNYNFQGSYNSYNDNRGGYDSEPRLSQVMEDYDNEPPLLEELGY